MVAWDDDGYSDRQEMRERWLAEWPEAGLDFDAFNGWYRQVMARHSLPDAAVNDFLAQLNRNGMPWGIVTNGNGRNQRSKCRAAGLEALTHFIIVSEEQGYAKPDQRIYQDAMSALGLASPDGVLFVGDNPVTDIDGAGPSACRRRGSVAASSSQRSSSRPTTSWSASSTWRASSACSRPASRAPYTPTPSPPPPRCPCARPRRTSQSRGR